MPSRKPPDQPIQGLFDFAERAPPPVELLEERGAPGEPPSPSRGGGSDSTPAPEPQRPPVTVRGPEPKTYAVSELVRAAARTVEARYGSVWVEGEISNLSAPRSGHLYFTLKDEDAQLPAVMFRSAVERLKFEPHDGLVVRARGRLSIYEGSGKFQLYADALEPAGLGALQLAFEQLKRKLEAEGLFARERKRPLPRWPRCIGVVTSPTGAAVRDILRIAERRGRVRLLISPCQVQGDGAAFDVIRALRRVERHSDVVIVARGGGSAEDLAAFNHEGLARAIAACRVPVVSAVGHEVDFTIADFVADQRAPTPSAAAELTVPLYAEAVARLDDASARLGRAGSRVLAEARLRLDGQVGRGAELVQALLMRRRRLLDHEARRLAALHPRARLHRDRAALDALTRRLYAQPPARLERSRAQLDGLGRRLRERAQQLLGHRRRELMVAVGRLGALSPLGVLERGYALTRTVDGHVVRDAGEVAPGDAVRIRVARGEIGARVEAVYPEGAAPGGGAAGGDEAAAPGGGAAGGDEAAAPGGEAAAAAPGLNPRRPPWQGGTRSPSYSREVLGGAGGGDEAAAPGGGDEVEPAAPAGGAGESEPA